MKSAPYQNHKPSLRNDNAIPEKMWDVSNAYVQASVQACVNSHPTYTSEMIASSAKAKTTLSACLDQTTKFLASIIFNSLHSTQVWLLLLITMIDIKQIGVVAL